MINRTLRGRFMPLGKMLLFCCIMAGLIAGFASAQENATNNNTCTGAELGIYANMAFCLPPEVLVEPETIGEANYSSGSEVAASMLLDGNRVELHLLYPCQPPQVELEAVDLKPYLDAYDPVFAQAIFNESVTSPVLVGQLGNLKFVANQRNQTLFLVTADMNLSDAIWGAFLENLMISINEGVAPASNCPGAASPETSEVKEEVAAQEPVQEDETSIASPSEPASPETAEKTIATGKDKMAADMAASKAMMDEVRNMARK
ncbi:MAG: hypothetical protein WBL92_07670 [Methanothrix sp.]